MVSRHSTGEDGVMSGAELDKDGTVKTVPYECIAGSINVFRGKERMKKAPRKIRDAYTAAGLFLNVELSRHEDGVRMQSAHLLQE